MNKYQYLTIVLMLTLTACPNNNNDTDNLTQDGKTYLKIDNNTEYAVNVYIDVPPVFDISPENIWRIEKGSSAQRELQPTPQGENGTTLYFEYLIPAGSSLIPYYPSNVDFIKLIKLEKEQINVIDVPSIEDLQLNLLFPDSVFVLIKNNSEDIIWFQRGIVTINPNGSNVRDILPNTNALFILDGNITNLNNSTIGNTSRYNFPDIVPLKKGYVHEFIVFEGETTPKIILDTVWRIKPKLTTTWIKEVTKHNPSNFSNEKLNTHLISIIRRLSISNWRSNYPVSKILYSNGQLINSEVSFGIIPAIIQNTGIVEPYEIPSFSVKNAEWENAYAPARNLYAGTSQLAYNTTFNDIIKLGNNYIVLTTYSNGLRSGICIFTLNSQGQTIDTWNIEPENNLESIIGTKLVKSDDNSFLVLGSKLEYSSVDDEHFTESTQFIRKYQIGNSTELWTTEYNYSSHFANMAICGLELIDSYIVCGTASDNSSTKTIILKVDKASGSIIDVKNYGAASESWKPFSVNSDNDGNIFLTGIATEGVNSKAYILKLNNSYSQVWLNKYGTNYDNFLFDLDIINNLLIAVGSSNDGSIYDPSFYGWQGGNGWIIKIDTNNGILIKEIIDNTVSSYNSIVQLDDGGFVLSAIKGIDNSKPYWFDTYAVKINEHLER